VAYAVLAALFFGASAPVAKLLLAGWGEVRLAGALYLASGIGLLLVRAVKGGRPSLRWQDVPWLLGAVVSGGLAAPVLLLFGLRLTTAHAGSLLLNLEVVFTAALAILFFRERLSTREFVAVAVLMAGAGAVGLGSAGAKEAASPILGGILVAAACFAWGVDNNLTRRVSERNPLEVAGVKGLVAGIVNSVLGWALGEPVPRDAASLAGAAMLGFVSYGLSLVLFVLALRRLGAARTSAYFGAAPLSGLALSWILLREVPGWITLAGGAAIVGGTLALSFAAKSGEFKEAL
jgi:drug/metabolite transporter (DMT)-like permease